MRALSSVALDWLNPPSPLPLFSFPFRAFLHLILIPSEPLGLVPPSNSNFKVGFPSADQLHNWRGGEGGEEGDVTAPLLFSSLLLLPIPTSPSITSLLRKKGRGNLCPSPFPARRRRSICPSLVWRICTLIQMSSKCKRGRRLRGRRPLQTGKNVLFFRLSLLIFFSFPITFHALFAVHILIATVLAQVGK